MPHPRKQLLFAVLSLADLGLTCWLLGVPGGRVYEANPVARCCLEHFGWAGLAGFKAAAVALVLGLSLLIARSRPRAAGTVLGLGCGITAAVVLYSASLLHTALRPDTRVAETGGETAVDLTDINRQARQVFRTREQFYEGLRQKVKGLLDGRLTLRDAAKWVATTELGRDVGWHRTLLLTYPGRSLEEAFAACVVAHAVSRVAEAGPQAAESCARRLDHELRLTYGPAAATHPGREE